MILDLSSKLFEDEGYYITQNYKIRLEVIRDFCQEELDRYKIFKNKKYEEKNKWLKENNDPGRRKHN